MRTTRLTPRVDTKIPSLLVTTVLLVFLFPVAEAWGAAGHRITAMVAQSYFSPASLALIQSLTGQGDLFSPSPTWPQGPINWADDYDHTDAGAWSYNLHFVYTNGFPYFSYGCDCRFQCDTGLAKRGYCQVNDTLSDCCVVAGIEKYQDELWRQFVKGETNSSAGAGNTNNATIKLVLFTHFIGDVHQPLHVDMVSPLNGNQYHVKWMGNTTCQTPPYPAHACQLHEIWDTLMLEKRIDEVANAEQPATTALDVDPRELAFAKHLLRKFGLLDNATIDQTGLQARLWASESVSLAGMAYLVDPGFDVDMHYYNASIPIIELQLFRAGTRMANALNFALGAPSCPACRWWPPLCRPSPPLPLPPSCLVGNSTSIRRRSAPANN